MTASQSFLSLGLLFEMGKGKKPITLGLIPAYRAEATRLQAGKKPITLGLILLTLTALYLIGPAWNAMSAGAACAVLLHIGLGLALSVPVGMALWRSLQRAWGAGRAARSLLALLAFLALACALTGLMLFLYAALGLSTARDAVLWWLHVLAGFAGVGAAGIWALRRRRLAVSSPGGSSPRTASALAGLLLLGPCAVWAAAALPEYTQDTYYRDLTATNALQAQNPSFPAGVRLAEGSAVEGLRAFPAAYCGRAGCHQDAYREWLPSGHRFAEADPFYRRVEAEYAARSGETAARWCAGCHAPESALRAEKREEREGFLSPVVLSSSSTSEGVSCVVCHAAAGTPTRTGNGRFTLAVPGNYPFGAAVGGWRRRLHDFLIRVRPGPHQRAFLKPDLHRSAEFCSACHRQSFSVAQNHYQFVRGPDEYGAWQAGPFSGRNARTPGLLAVPPQTCQDCHFPHIAGHTSHAALGANTAVPALAGDQARVRQTEAFLQAGRITLDLFALRRERGPNRPEEWIAPLDAAPAVLRPDERLRLDVVVGNRGVGHSFPAGYSDIRDAWLEVTLRDGQGRLLLASGLLPSDESPLPPDTHAYRMVPLDRAGNALTRHELTAMVTMAYDRVIAPGSADIARYELILPQRGLDGAPLVGPLRLAARLRYRHLRPDFARWALSDLTPFPSPSQGEGSGPHPLSPFPNTRRGGTEKPTLSLPSPVRGGRGWGPAPSQAGSPPSLPGKGAGGLGQKRGERAVLPIITLAESSVTLPLKAERARVSAPAGETAARFLQYGVGLLAPTEAPDLPRALRAFQRAQELAPDRPEPRLGLGRAYFKEAALLSARSQFEAALRLAPGDPAAQAELGTVANKQGEYDRALRLLTPLTARFPQDVALQKDLGLALFQLGSYAEAALVYRRALAADPDDAAAHYKLKWCDKQLQRIPEARREEAIGRYLAEDKLAPLLVPRYRRAHPQDTLAAEGIPVHKLRLPRR
ncbi:MAG TPA: tetratricopeptide repeat protein [Chthonomonadaceae bacterium]|nr:tetratricopeptide repeat protein [Chthonomonadaceae bacterium]